MKIFVTATTLVIGIATLFAFLVMSPSLAAPAEPAVATAQLNNPVLSEHKSSKELSDRLIAEHEAALAIAAAEADLLAAAEKSEQLTYAQLQVYILTYGCTPEDRRNAESGGDYGIYTGNGYVGAYQFSEQYIAGWMTQAGLGNYNRDDFLANPGLQDQLADWYADYKWGGWSNVPSTGGW